MKTGWMQWLALAGLMALAAPAAAVYRCETDQGPSFSDQPCGEDAQSVTIRDNRIGGSFGDNMPEPEEREPEADQERQRTEETEKESTCRFINSTDLRTYLAREQVVEGMTQEQVLRAFGRPPETYPTPQETWIYQTKYYDKLYELTYVYFKDGCVESVEYRKP